MLIRKVQCVVSPANAFGLMDGGYDLAMLTPQLIEDPRVIYQCMRTTLMEAKKNNIESILIPMFGGSCGGVRPQIVAEMMWKAYKQLQAPPTKIDWEYAEKMEMLPETDFRIESVFETSV